MKKITLVLLFIFVLIKVYSQNEPSFNLGLSLPIFFKSSLHWNAEANGSTQISGYNLFGEKPFPIGINKITLHLTPGLFYTTYSENKQSPTSALGGYSNGSYKHKSIGLYNKTLFDVAEFFPLKNIFYSGIYTGFHLYSTTKGHESTVVYTQPPQSWNSTIDDNGNLFYKTLVFGLLVGMKPNYNRNLNAKPSIELTFFPCYAKLLDYYIDRENVTEYNRMLSVSFILGFGSKKPANNNLIKNYLY